MKNNRNAFYLIVETIFVKIFNIFVLKIMSSYTLVVTGFRKNLGPDAVMDALYDIFGRIDQRVKVNVESGRVYLKFRSKEKGKQGLRFNGSVTDIGTLSVIPEYYLRSIYVNPTNYEHEDRKIERLIKKYDGHMRHGTVPYVFEFENEDDQDHVVDRSYGQIRDMSFIDELEYSNLNNTDISLITWLGNYERTKNNEGYDLPDVIFTIPDDVNLPFSLNSYLSLLSRCKSEDVVIAFILKTSDYELEYEAATLQLSYNKKKPLHIKIPYGLDEYSVAEITDEYSQELSALQSRFEMKSSPATSKNSRLIYQLADKVQNLAAIFDPSGSLNVQAPVLFQSLPVELKESQAERSEELIIRGKVTNDRTLGKIIVQRRQLVDKLKKELNEILILNTYVVHITNLQFKFSLEEDDVEIRLSITFQLLTNEDYHSSIGYYKSRLNSLCKDSRYKIDELYKMAEELGVDITGIDSKEQLCEVLNEYIDNMLVDIS